ncbi:hypothetical protein [Variovorax rhizosphaerae]|uniref:Uncharacterized protein n=1 Tax=Variovorax rhizosphaerae TaxID=1836200 RepID=A0ABU8WFT6_9BURK
MEVVDFRGQRPSDSMTKQARAIAEGDVVVRCGQPRQEEMDALVRSVVEKPQLIEPVCVLTRLLPGTGDRITQIAQVLRLLAVDTLRLVEGTTRPRPSRKIKPNVRHACKG